MAPKFLCCLPLRLGTFVITFVQLIVCGLAASGFWYLIRWTRDEGVYHDLQNNVKIAFIVAGAVYTFAAIIGLLGFLGAIFKKRGLIRTYLAVLYVTLMLQTASGVYSLVMFYRFREHPGLRPDCDNSPSDTAVVDFCNALERISNMPLSGIWVSTLVPIVVVAYACYVVHNYATRLVKQQADREIIATRSFATGPEYTAVKPHEEIHPLTQPAYSYPYSDAPHSFGNTASGQAANYYNSENKV